MAAGDPDLPAPFRRCGTLAKRRRYFRPCFLRVGQLAAKEESQSSRTFSTLQPTTPPPFQTPIRTQTEEEM